MATPSPFTQNVMNIDPRQFPGLFIWNDAQNVTGTNGSALTSNVWENRAATLNYNTYASSCSTTARYSTNTLNGYPVMDFLTTNIYIFNCNAVVAPTDITMLFITRNTGTQANSRRILQGSNVNILYGYWGGYKNALFLNGTPSILNTAPAILSDNNWDLYSLQRSQKGPYFWSWFGSNVSIGGSSSTPFSGLAINTGTAPGETTACQVAELLVYSNALLPEQVRALEGYLAWKWGLQSNLPSYHPFVSSVSFCKVTRPLDLTNAPSTWFDASYSKNIVASGNTITTWTSLGCNAMTLTQGNASAPFVQTGVNTLNGYNVVYWPQASWLSTNSFQAFSQTKSQFGIIQPLFVNSTYPYISYQTQNNNNNRNSGLTFSIAGGGGGSNLCAIGASGIANTVAFWTTTAPSNSWLFFSIVDAQNTTYNNGTENGSNRTLATNTVATYGNIAGALSYNFGGVGASVGYNTSYNMGEFLEYDYDTSSAERQMIEGYIAWKWGQTSLLPAAHPFKSLQSTTPVFNPLNINTSNTTSVGRGTLQCVLWMDAAQDATANGVSVTSLADRSGSGYTITNVAGNTITKTVPGLNGLPVFNFGANRMTIASFIWRTKFTCFFVTQANAGQFLYSQFTAGAYNNYVFGGNNALASLNNNATGNVVDSVTALGTSVTGTGWNIFVFGFNNGTTGTPYRINGTARATNTFTTTADTNVTAALFINGNGTGQFDTSQVAEILHYNDNLTLAQCQKIEGYLAWKWGLVGNLPNAHPYKIAPP